MDVDWSKTAKGKEAYREQCVTDFKDMGVSHVRIRIKDPADEALFRYLGAQIDDCLAHQLIPVIAYQADEFKNSPTQENIDQAAARWGAVAERYRDKSPLLSFDLLIEATDALNKQPEKLNEIYERLVTEIRRTNPERIIMISPRLRSDAACLSELKVPTGHNGYLMAEWHFYAAGPSRTNERKLWTTGTEEEKDKIREKISLALQWQKETGIPTWVGAWMPGNYNDGNDYTIAEQAAFAKFMTDSLTGAGIPFAVNSDTKFYDRETNEWIEEMLPVFYAIYREESP
ncbi:MAG: cellulase family glycosylhydrolase [Oscillospiraceae bacterium]|nr:cellulase family glycosylhydrolase [Oscillospiraceae bacterium]